MTPSVPPPPDTVLVERVVHDTLRVTTYVLQHGKDAWDRLGIVSSLIISPIVSIAAAIIGARVGGQQAQEAAIAAQKAEAHAEAVRRAEEAQRLRHDRLRRGVRMLDHRLERLEEFILSRRGPMVVVPVPGPDLRELLELCKDYERTVELVEDGLPSAVVKDARSFFEGVTGKLTLSIAAAEQLIPLKAEHGDKGGSAYTQINRLTAIADAAGKALMGSEQRILNLRQQLAEALARVDAESLEVDRVH